MNSTTVQKTAEVTIAWPDGEPEKKINRKKKYEV